MCPCKLSAPIQILLFGWEDWQTYKQTDIVAYRLNYARVQLNDNVSILKMSLPSFTKTNVMPTNISIHVPIYSPFCYGENKQVDWSSLMNLCLSFEVAVITCFMPKNVTFKGCFGFFSSFKNELFFWLLLGHLIFLISSFN